MDNKTDKQADRVKEFENQRFTTSRDHFVALTVLHLAIKSEGIRFDAKSIALAKQYRAAIEAMPE